MRLHQYKKLRFLREIYADRPGSQTIHALNRSLESAGMQAVQHQPSKRLTNIARHLDQRELLRNFFQLPGKAYIAPLMWPKAARLFPICYFGEIIPICFDCWPVDYDVWEAMFNRHRVKTAFFTARQSRDYFKDNIPGMRSYWLAEACDPLEYPFSGRLVDRTIDVLELGRRSEPFHDAITGDLERYGFRHLYVKEGQRRMFPTRQELMEAWQQTKISICFPKSVTSDERSGGVETVTFRYFESMASRCLIVGRCPSELVDIFGYNPVVEVDAADPAGQLLAILKDIDSYQDLVERNHKKMLEVGSWQSRVDEMITILHADGYSL